MSPEGFVAAVYFGDNFNRVEDDDPEWCELHGQWISSCRPYCWIDEDDE